jgi:hypothetical protein
MSNMTQAKASLTKLEQDARFARPVGDLVGMIYYVLVGCPCVATAYNNTHINH